MLISLSICKNNKIDLTNSLLSDVSELYEWFNRLKLNNKKILIYKVASLISNICIARQPLSQCKTYNFEFVILDKKLDFKQYLISIQFYYYLIYCISWNCDDMYTLVIYCIYTK